jgi:hypothetical protein
MINKSLALAIICGLIVSGVVFGAYRIGYTNGAAQNSNLGLNQTFDSTQGSYYRAFQDGNRTGFTQGYQAGLKAGGG